MMRKDENKFLLFLSAILVYQAFLLGYRLSSLMPFIGDQAWFYISAKDMLLTGHIPLVGIASSHPWLHQGALWTYCLAFALQIFHFSPYAGVYLTVCVAFITTIAFYSIGKNMFSQSVGLVSAFLYATSPLISIYNRMPYHTTFIPLCTLLLIFCIYHWLEEKIWYFPFIIGLFAILYNLELATSVLWLPFIILVLYGFWERKKYITSLRNKEIITISLLCFIVPMLPMLIYDVSHYFVQTLGFAAWLGYKILTLFGFSLHHATMTSPTIVSLLKFLFVYWQRFIFLPNSIVGGSIGIFVIGYFIVNKQLFFNNRAVLLSAIFLLIVFFGFLVARTTSEAYIPMFLPEVIFMLAVCISWILSTKYSLVFLLVVFLYTIVNSLTLLQTNYLLGSVNGYGATFIQRMDVAKKIVTNADGKPYNLVGKGQGSQFASFTMNTAYLTWWLGHPPVNSKQKLQFILQETNGQLRLHSSMLQ